MLFTPLSVSINPSVKRPTLHAFERFIGDVVKAPSKFSNVTENPNDYTLEIDVPGVNKSELMIKIEEQIVRIETQADAARKYNLSFELPVAIDPNASQAKLENGVLSLTLTKKQALSNVTLLQIQ